MEKFFEWLLSLLPRRIKVRQSVSLQDVQDYFTASKDESNGKAFVLCEEISEKRKKIVVGYLDDEGEMIGDPSIWLTKELTADLQELFKNNKLVILT